jgi:hypothetical protein
MRLAFEDWLERATDCPDEARVAFKEAVVSYKAGAYRAGLVFSYVGMGLWLRIRLLAANQPSGMTPGEWHARQNELRDENKWDPTVFELTQQQGTKTLPKEVFSVDDHLRQEMLYWKNRRNDCAHFKRKEIGASHVEAFWLFLETSIGRWVPNGSKEDLLARIEKHYDLNYTAPGTDVAFLAQAVPHAVPESTRKDFFDALEAQFTHTIGSASYYKPGIADFLSVVLRVDAASRNAVTWLLHRPTLTTMVLRLFPGHVQLFKTSPDIVRRIWRSELIGNPGVLPVFTGMLRNGAIPQSELSEAIEFIVEKNTELPSTKEAKMLERNGFWVEFRKQAIEKREIDSFSWANPKASLIAWWVENYPLDSETARVICSTFSGLPFPYSARDALKQLLASNPTKKAELESLAKQENTTIPQELL